MIEFANMLDQIFGQGIVQLLFILVAIVGIAGLVLNSPARDKDNAGKLQKRTKYFWLSLTLVAFPVLCAFAIIGFLISVANNDIDSKLASGVSHAIVNGRSIANPAVLAGAIALRCDTGNIRSHPETRHNIVIETREGPLHLQLGQDSVKANSYWVFYPKFALTRSNEVRRACELRGVSQ